MTFICILSGCGNADSVQNTEQKSGYKQVSMEEGLELMEADSDYILLDVRRDDEFEEGHIPGAINIPNESIGTEEIAQLPDKNQTIYVYCRSGNRSKQASQKLVDLRNVCTGLSEWCNFHGAKGISCTTAKDKSGESSAE